MTSEPPVTPAFDATYFDQWYANMESSAARDDIVARTLGLPPELQSTSLLPWQGIAEVTDALRLRPSGVLLDVGCGRGGYGIEIAGRTGARVVGVDFSAVAVEAARSNAARALPGDRAEFHVGTLETTGLPAGIADAVLCVDAVQFADPPQAALTEFLRLLRPGGRVAVTCWEAVEAADPRVPRRVRDVSLRRDLAAAGFVDVDVQEKVDWRALERSLWEAAVAVPAGTDQALVSLREEGQRSLAAFESLRRVFATATAPPRLGIG